MDVDTHVTAIEQAAHDMAAAVLALRRQLNEAQAKCAGLAAELAIAKAQLAARHEVEFYPDFDLDED